jgi:hypothetical protein
MVPEDLLFWVDTFHPADGHDTGVLCRRHADAMVVPRGWTLDDRREPHPRLFRSTVDPSGAIARPRRRRASGSSTDAGDQAEQLVLPSDAAAGTSPDAVDTPPAVAAAVAEPAPDPAAPWAPAFDSDDDLDGLLQVESPLLARAFRGTERAR